MGLFCLCSQETLHVIHLYGFIFSSEIQLLAHNTCTSPTIIKIYMLKLCQTPSSANHFIKKNVLQMINETSLEISLNYNIIVEQKSMQQLHVIKSFRSLLHCRVPTS